MFLKTRFFEPIIFRFCPPHFWCRSTPMISSLLRLKVVISGPPVRPTCMSKYIKLYKKHCQSARNPSFSPFSHAVHQLNTIKCCQIIVISSSWKSPQNQTLVLALVDSRVDCCSQWSCGLNKWQRQKVAIFRQKTLSMLKILIFRKFPQNGDFGPTFCISGRVFSDKKKILGQNTI